MAKKAFRIISHSGHDLWNRHWLGFAAFFRTLVLLILLARSLPAAPTHDRAEAFRTYEEVRLSPSGTKSRRDWMKMADKFKRLENLEGDPEESAQTTFTLGRIYHESFRLFGKKKDQEEALRFFRETWQKFPTAALADDSLYQEAFMLWSESQDAEATRLNLERILQGYPDGDQAEGARILLNQLPRSRETRRFAIDPKNLAISSSAKDGFSLTLPIGSDVYVKDYFYEKPNPKIVIDLRGAEFLGAGISTTRVEKGGIRRIRLAQFSQDTIRLVVDLTEKLPYELESSKGASKMTLHIFPRGKQVATKSRTKSPVRKAERPLIVIDAGHGGEDPGAIGKKGVREKDVTLSIAKMLEQKLAKANYRTLLTRSKDVFIPLEDRPRLANERKADLFISIHCNAHPKPKMRGVQTFFLDTIKDEYSRKLAARENAISLDRLSDLEMILLDLSNRENHALSSRFAGVVQKTILKHLSKKYSGIEDQGVRTAVFLVLFYADMPSVLVETAFLSNLQEENRLNSAAYQGQLAEALATAIGNYFQEGERFVGTL